MKNLIILLFIAISVISCTRQENLEEGDRNTYTWKGTIYKDYSDEPLKNTSVRLEAEYNAFGTYDQELLGETTTDENGYYTITYKHLKKPASVVNLYTGDGFSSLPIKSGESNKSYESDLSTKWHARIELSLLIPEDLEDTVFIGISGLQESEYLYMLFEEGYGYSKILAIPPLQKADILVNMKCDVVGYNSNGIKTGISLALGRQNFISGDSNDIRTYTRYLKGFPNLDTISIQF